MTSVISHLSSVIGQKTIKSDDGRLTTDDSKKGFTLIEILVAVAIVAILATIGFTVYAGAEKAARDAKRKEDLREFASGIEVYHQVNNAFPVAAGSPGKTSLSGTWSTFLGTSYINKMPIDPLNKAPYVYTYTSQTGSAFDICGLLENTTQPTSPNIIPAGGVCGGSGTQLFYHVSGP